MHESAPTLLLAALALLPSQSGDDLAPLEVVEGEIGYQVDEFLTRLEGVGFSGIVGVEHDGEPILIRGYGMADREHEIPVTPATVFCTGSITKQFTAAAILALQDDGKLSVKDPLEKFFADVPADKRGITLHHLLTHTSGLVDSDAGDHDLRATADWVRQQAFGAELSWPPGGGHRYMNVNFSLLGMVVERVSGQPYEAFLAERLFARAGMRSTGYFLPRFDPATLAIGYRNGEAWGTVLGRPMLADGPCWTLRGNGGIHSTVGDMLRWHRALQSGEVLSKAARDAMETPHAEEEGGGSFYGYGWSIQRSPTGGKLVAHNGGNQVFFADMLRFVDEGWCVFLATNVGSRMREDIAYDVARILFGKGARAVPETMPRDRDTLAAYAGRYSLGEDSALEFDNLGDRLRLRGTGEDAQLVLEGAGPGIELFPLDPREFRAYDDREGWGIALRFDLDENGRARAVTLGDPPVSAERE